MKINITINTEKSRGRVVAGTSYADLPPLGDTPPLTKEEERDIRHREFRGKARVAVEKTAKAAAKCAKAVGGAALKVVRAASKSAGEIIDDLSAEIRDDVAAVRERDPAARSSLEVCLLYSGVHAMLAYRVAHRLYINEKYLSARAVSQFARFCTGIEIHPGATIGRRLVIDHGSGVVIGETCTIGDDCTIYQGVTLGGTGKDVGKRHPTLGNRVMVGAGAKVLGPFNIGDGAKIAAGAVVLKEIPAGATAVGIPARVVRRDGERVDSSELDQIHIPDPVSQQLSDLEAKLAELRLEVEELKK